MVQYVSYKKPIIFIIGFLFFTQLIKAQDLATAQNFYNQKDFARAKESVDSFVLINTDNAEGFLLNANIYNAINKDVDTKYLVADGWMEAFQSLQKAVQINSGYVNEQLKPTNYSLPFDLYNGYTNDAVAYFNAGAERNDKNSYSEALARFKKAGLVSNYIYTNGWGLSLLDSSNLYYSAKAAINAGKDDDALLFAKKIATADITQTIASKGFESIYRWLVYYYKQQKDGENFNKYVAMGIERFPATVYFNLIMIDWLRQQKDYTNLFVAYAALLKKQPESKYQFAYLNDVFNYLYESKVEIKDRGLYESKLKNGLLQYIKTNAAAVDGRLLLGKFYMNKANDLGKEMLLRSTTDAKVMNGYKTGQINLLRKSNQYLKEIVYKFCKQDLKICKEAGQLQRGNLQFIKIIQEVRRYKPPVN